MNKILTLEEARNKPYFWYNLCTGDYQYKTEDGYCHIIRGEIDLLAGLKATDSFIGFNGVSSYRSENSKYWCTIEDGVAGEILTREEIINKDLVSRSYPSGDYSYQTKDKYWHLIRDGVDLLAGLKALACWYYLNGDYAYESEFRNGSRRFKYLIRDGVNLLEGKKAIECYSCVNGDYTYTTESYWFNEVSNEIRDLSSCRVNYLIRDGVDLLAGLETTDLHTSFKGNHSYKTKDGKTHLIPSNPSYLGF